MRLMLTPHDFQNSMTWRRAICEHLLGWIHADAVHVRLSSCASAPLVGAGCWGSAVAREYTANWYNNQEVDNELARRNLPVWVREQIISTRDIRRTRYYGEFCARHRNLDSAGCRHRFHDGEDVVLHLNACRHGAFTAGALTHAVITLLQPTLVAGAAATRAPRDVDHCDLLDASGRAIAVLTLDGHLQHVTPRLALIASDPTISVALRTTMRQLAKEVGRLLRTGSFEKRVVPSVTIASGGTCLVATASIVRERISSKAPLCLVTVSEQGSGSNSPTSGVSLTARERQVADMLARGERNEVIAAALDVTQHTARRHTEHVLRKLGVRSRAAVASVLRKNSVSSPNEPTPQSRS